MKWLLDETCHLLKQGHFGKADSMLDADFANILRFPPGITPGVRRLKIHPPLEDAVLELMRLALDLLKDTILKGYLAVAHGNTVRIKR